MKKILGLDLGVASIGWALVKQGENELEKSSIEHVGVRVNPITVDEQTKFETGKSIPTNADRTLKRNMRRNLQRYKLRRNNLIEILLSNGFITNETILSEHGNNTTFETYRLRAKAVTEKVTLEEFARVLLNINKKRGYKSSRKTKSIEEGSAIDGMNIARILYDKNLTPGQLTYDRLLNGKKIIPEFYISDLRDEFDRIWYFQNQFYPDILTDSLKEELLNKNEKQSWTICQKTFNLEGLKRETKGESQKIENYKWRVQSLTEKMNLEELAIVFQKINGQIHSSSGYLGAISDRSKELYFKKQTIGQYLIQKLNQNPNYSLKNTVFYRQDYLDEFEKIWENQSSYHPELTKELKKKIRDSIIFYQRPLKSQKGLVSFCEFESKSIEIEVDGKMTKKNVGCRVCPISSPLFQEFKIWQMLNNVIVSGKGYESRELYQEEKNILHTELSIKSKITKKDALNILYGRNNYFDLNYKELEGNRTQAQLFNTYQSIIELSGNGEFDFSKLSARETISTVTEIFKGLGFNTDILIINTDLKGDDFWNQPLLQLWHLLYSYEGDKSISGIENLVNIIHDKFGFPKEYAKLIANISFESDYGNLSSKAMLKILPYLKEGNKYDLACSYAGYRHSKDSLTKEELVQRPLKDRLDPLKKNSLRNPVVEKILNQMVNVINSVIENFGKPDEIHIELARELKKSAKERDEMSKNIANATKEHDRIKKLLENEFGMLNVSRNDILRYKLYKELEFNGYHTLYSNTYIPKEKIFSKEFNIEHIIPQSRLFDDSFSNKTLESRSVNIEKNNSTALDYIITKYGETSTQTTNFLNCIEDLLRNNKISKAKYNKLKMRESDIPTDFINRDLRDSQYIAKKAKEMVSDLVRNVVTTTGSVTDRLRKDWQLEDVMQELNWDKYNKLGLTEYIKDKEGKLTRRIKDWTKRNDHRHHAMDAITIAFTKTTHIQYLNNLNARIQRGLEDPNTDIRNINLENIDWKDRTKVVRYIENKELYRDKNNKLRFCPPMPLDLFRSEAKKALENTLVSIKTKNKVSTNNTNVSKKLGGTNKRIQLTPRGQLHEETIYGTIKQYATKIEKIGSSFNEEKILTVANQKERNALWKRLMENDNDPKKAFTGKNSIEKNPIWIDSNHTQMVPEKVKTVMFERFYTTRKPIDPKLNIHEVVDATVRRILENRLLEYDNDATKAFSNLEDNPVWINKEKNISIKRVTIKRTLKNVIALHDKKDMDGKTILDNNGNKQACDFVSPGNNHHVAIYRDENGSLQEKIVTFFEATERARQGLPIVDKSFRQSEGWQFLFTLKQNEFFVFPNQETGFDPSTIDLTNPSNYHIISPNLFRVQKFSYKNYVFRHHLETSVDSNYSLKGITWTDFRSSKGLDKIVKVRINHIGQIVSVGEN